MVMTSHARLLSEIGELPPITGAEPLPDVVDLAEIDLDFAGDEPRHTDAVTVRSTGGITTLPAASGDLGVLELFRGVTGDDLAAFAAQARVIEAAPGCVLQSAGHHGDRILFVLSGELRMYSELKEKRARGIVDAGQSVGLYWSLMQQPAEVAIVATEVSRVLELRLPVLEEFARRSHALACNFNALLASYLRGDNCLNLGARALAAMQQRHGYTDELTQLHNQHWLETMLPRLLGRSRHDNAPLSVAMLAVDKLESIEREFGSIAGDQILAAVGQLLLNVARTTDLLVCDDNRHFLAILPNTTLDGARILCQRLHQEIRSLRIDASDDRPLPSLTFSSGIVQRDGQTAAELLGRATALVQRSLGRGGDSLSE
jgi:diguanylate cyclase (GGDEF)-like protein